MRGSDGGASGNATDCEMPSTISSPRASLSNSPRASGGGRSGNLPRCSTLSSGRSLSSKATGSIEHIANKRPPLNRSLSLLFVTAHLPSFGVHAGGGRMFHLLRGLSRYHQINLLSYVEREDDLEHLPSLRQFCQKVKFVLRGQTFDAYNPFGLKPRQLTRDYGNPQMFQAIAGELSTGEYVLCQIEYLETTAALPRDVPIPLILTHHELQFAAILRAARLQNALSRRLRMLLGALIMFNYEIEVLKRFDTVVAMSRMDAGAMRAFLPHLDVRISPMAVDTDYFTPQEGKGEPDSIIYTGYYEHYPNEDAVIHFVREIFPLIQRKIPNAKFYIVGSYPSSAVLELGRVKNVMVTGWVEDLRPWLAKATIFVAPIRLGRGMRGKIPEAMAMRKPIVGSSVAFAGLEATDGKHALIADDPSDFAEKVIKLLKDSRLREEIASNRSEERRVGKECRSR